MTVEGEDEWETSAFWPHEAEAVADFLVEVIGLEAAIVRLLSRYYAHPDRAEEFTAQFLDKV